MLAWSGAPSVLPRALQLSCSRKTRIKAARLVADSRSVAVVLGDTEEWQSFRADFGVTASLTIEIESVYPGSKYSDVGLTEVAFFARTAPRDG